MKLTSLLPLVGLSVAFVMPNEQVFNELTVEDRRQHQDWSSSLKAGVDYLSNALDDAFEQAVETTSDVTSKIYESTFDVEAWIESAADRVSDMIDEPEHPPHKKPHHGGPDRDRPHPPPHHGKSNLTVYELIAKSKYTTKLAKLINEYPDLVEALNGTEANYTVFAPTDKAFERLPENGPLPSKEELKEILSYHVSPDFYPAGRVLGTHTIPTLLKGKHLPGKVAQRLSVNIGLKGLTVNFYARVIAINIFGTNGVIHGVDHIIVPPPKITKIVSLLPSEFSTLELALAKTGLNKTDHPPGTLFAPSNFAFSRLGARVNAFLFSPRGLPYLEALLKYHIAPGNVLYSDAFYEAKGKDVDSKGQFHVDLPTLLDDKSLSIDIAKFYGIIEMKINSFSRVSIFDGVAEDGVIQVVSSVIVPPKKLAGKGTRLPKWNFWSGEEEMELEDFIERFEPYVSQKMDL